LFAVKMGAVATPEALVVAVAVFELVPANVPLAPEAGALKVTVTFGTPLLLASFTVATSAANAALICTDCGVPLVAAIELAVPTVFVRKKVAFKALMDAVTK
jgi:hypothetical protein